MKEYSEAKTYTNKAELRNSEVNTDLFLFISGNNKICEKLEPSRFVSSKVRMYDTYQIALKQGEQSGLYHYVMSVQPQPFT